MDQLVQQALRQYKDEFGEEFDPTWNPTSEKDLADKLRSSQADFDRWRSKNGQIWKTLTAIALPISNLGKVAASATQATFPPAAAGIAGLLSLVTACEKVSEANDFLEQMFTKLSDVLSRWDIDLKHDVNEYMRDKMKQILLLLFSIIARSRKVMHSRAKRWLAGLVFGNDRKTADLIKELENLLQSEDRARTTLTLAKIGDLWEKSIRTENTAVVERLNSPAVKINEVAFAFRLEDRIVDTGLWLRDDILYESWISKEAALLMVLGVPGSGKSYLATGLIEDMIQKRNKQNTESDSDTVAYYYFNQESNLTQMLTTMAYQIQQTDAEYRQYVIETLDQGDLRTAKEAWAKLFLDYWQPDLARGAVLIVDGLSEATPDEIELFAEMVKAIVKQSGSKIRVAIFGLLQIWGEFDFVAQKGFIEITSGKNRLDIAAYVDRELSKHRQLKKDKPEVRDEFKGMILEHCDEVFEWARLILGRCKNQDKTRMRKLLEQPPQSLNDMVKSCFDQIMDDEDLDAGMLKILLTLLTYEKWPLRFGEIHNMILIITGEQHAFLWWNIVRKLSSVVRWRTSRVRRVGSQSDGDDDEDHIEILDEDKGWSDQIRTTWITLGNARIRNYVIRQGESESHLEDHVHKWPSSSQKSEVQMVMVCLRVLRDEHVIEKKNWSLLEYPLRFMAIHLKNIDLEATDPEDKLEIATGIVWMFHNEGGLLRVALLGSDESQNSFLAFWRMWIETREYTDVVQSWLRWGSTTSLAIDTSADKWVGSAAVSRKALLNPLADFLRRNWLDADHSPKAIADYREFEKVASLAVHFLVTYDNMDDQEEFPPRFQNYFQFQSFGPSAEDIIASAEKLDLPRRGSYFVGLAFTFKNLGRSLQSLQFIEAVPDDDTAAWAKAWFQYTSYLGQGKYDQAVSYARKASELNPHARSDIEDAITRTLVRKGDRLGALEAAKINYDRDSTSASFQLNYLRCLFLRKEYKTILEIVKRLDEITMPDAPHSQIVSLLIENKGGTLVALQAMGQAYMSIDSKTDRYSIEDVLNRTTQAIAHTEGEARQIKWQNELARFKFKYVDDGVRSSVEMRLANMIRVQDTKLIPDKVQQQTELIWTRSNCANALYFLACTQEAESDTDLSSTIEMLRNLAVDAEKVDTSALTIRVGFSAQIPRFYYGRWLRNHTSEEDDSWRRYFRPSLLSYLDMLDDKHEQNDVFGIVYAAMTLREAGDFEDSLALSANTFRRKTPEQQDHQVDLAQTSAVEKSNDKGRKLASGRGTGVRDDYSPENFSSLADTLSVVHVDQSLHSLEPSVGDEEATLAMKVDRDISWSCTACNAHAEQITELKLCTTCLHHLCDQCMPESQLHPMLGYPCGNHHQFERLWPVPEKLKDRATVMKGDIIHLENPG